MRHHTLTPGQEWRPHFSPWVLSTSTDTLFPGAAGDLDLYTDMEISGLVKSWVIEALNRGTRDPHTASPASKVETASSIKKRDNRDSPG